MRSFFFLGNWRLKDKSKEAALVTCAGTGKAPTCVLHHAKPWDYNKHARTGIHT
jgi:hypothetical protein